MIESAILCILLICRFYDNLKDEVKKRKEMKKIIINMSDSTYEKLRFESIKQKKELKQIISERILCKEFDLDVEEAFEKWAEDELIKIMRD